MAKMESVYPTESIEVLTPNPDIIRITETVLAQHSEILRINSRLLDVLSSPILIADRNKI